MLDAVPPGMILVDGCENGYYMDSAEAYLQAAHEMRSWNGASVRLVSPQNRAKYRQQVQAGFGFYLDMYLNPEGNHYYFPPLNNSRLARLQRNLGLALEAADEYVWIYGEQCRWWGPRRDLPNTVGQGRLWEEAMPGITRAIAYTRDPLAAAKAELAELRKIDQLTNLAKNADFRQAATRQRTLGWARRLVEADARMQARHDDLFDRARRGRVPGLQLRRHDADRALPFGHGRAGLKPLPFDSAAIRRTEVAVEQRNQRGLAGAVGPGDEPVLTGRNRPVERPEHAASVPIDARAPELQHWLRASPCGGTA